jgi:hypothetical protein
MTCRAAWILLLLGGVAAPAAAQDTSAPVVKGMIATTLFVQSDAFGYGNGQNAQWVRPARVGVSDRVMGGDVRNSRVTLLLPASRISDALQAGAVIEIDFFGGFNGAGPLSDEQPLPRLRSAYADLTYGRTVIRVGQAFTPIFGHAPVSTSHLAFPLGFGSAGVIGFRSPGVFVYHGFSDAAARFRVGAQAGAFRGSWAGSGDLVDHGSPAEAAAVPQLEARLDLSGRTVDSGTTWSTYIAGHYDEKNVVHAGEESVLAGRAVAVGARVDHGPVTVHGNAYRGRAIAQQMGQMAQFGDIGGGGEWIQAGVRLGRGWSLWTFAGQDDPHDADLLSRMSGDVRLRNRLGAVSAQVTLGGYTAGVQWLRASTDWGNRSTQGDRLWNRQADQLAMSVVYRF